MSRHQHHYHNLCFEGGSVKGVGYVGALKAINAFDLFDFHHIRRIAGTSAGAITAVLLCVGYTPAEIQDVLFGAESQQAVNFLDFISSKSLFKLKGVADTKSHSGRLFKGTTATPTASSASYQLYANVGLCDGEYFRLWIDQMIQEKVSERFVDIIEDQIAAGHGGSASPIGKKTYIGMKSLMTSDREVYQNYFKHLTFHELHMLTEMAPEYFKDLYVVGYDVSASKAQTFSFEAGHTPNDVISDAVRISMSIPFVFRPHGRHVKKSAGRISHKDQHIFVDGGVVCNYPLGIFDDSKYFEEDVEGYAVNPHTLGFCLVTSEVKNYLNDPAPQEDVNEEDAADKAAAISLFPFVKAVMGAYMDRQKKDHIASAENVERTVHIDTLGVGMLDFDITDAGKWKLYESGRQAICEKFQKEYTPDGDNPFNEVEVNEKQLVSNVT